MAGSYLGVVLADSGRIRRKRERRSARTVAAPAVADPRQLAMALLAMGEPDSLTLGEFWERWIDDYAKANRHKPRGIDSKESILRNHLVPMLGGLPLNRIADEHVQRLKATLSEHKAKTVNNVLTVLSKLLKTAVRWRVLPRMPVTIELLKVAPPIVGYYDFEQYARLLDAATEIDARTLAVVLLGGDAGLRLGEMAALEWDDLDFKRAQLHVRRSVSQGEVTLPKGGRPRTVPMTDKLVDVLCALHHNRTAGRVLVRDDRSNVSEQTVRTWISHAQRRAGVGEVGKLHVLRHTFCSHLAMKGAPLIAIKELAGHESERTTMRYMHLAPSEKSRAIELLNARHSSNGQQMPPSSAAVSPTGFEPVGGSSSGESKTSTHSLTVGEETATRRGGVEGCAFCGPFGACYRHNPEWTPSLYGKIR